jgi:hypothetical protein
MPAERWLRAYYAVTPVFFLLDGIWGISIRASGLDPYPAAKYGYYLFCLACAWVMWKRARWAGPTAFMESAINLVVLFVGFLGPLFRMAGADVESGPLQNPFTLEHVANFVISGSAAILAFHRNEPRFLSQSIR